MPSYQGLQIWDEYGNLKLDITDSVPLILGHVDSGTSDGSYTITHALKDKGTLFTLSKMTAFLGYGPIVSISGYDINWSFMVSAATFYLSPADTRIFYGIR